MSRVWFITGSSTGLGRALVERALSQGDRVAATLRKPSDISDLSSTYPPTQLLVLPLDVTSPSTAVSAALTAAAKAFGRIDIVVSNAGNGGATGEAEIIPEVRARQTMEINFWGAAKVAVESLKVFRDINSPQGGLFIHVSSANGIDGQPLTAFYAASKFAVEGWLDAFSRELDPAWNVKIQIMNPGGFNTPFATKNGDVLPQSPLYSSLGSDHPAVQMRSVFNFVVQGIDVGLPGPEVFVNGVMDVVERREKGEDLPFRVPIGYDSLGIFKKKIKDYADSIDKFEPLSKDCKFMAPQ